MCPLTKRSVGKRTDTLLLRGYLVVSPLPESEEGLALLYPLELRLGKGWVTTRTLSAVTRKRGPNNMIFTSGLPRSS